MINVRAKILEQRLNQLVLVTGKTKSHYVRVALQAYLDEITREPENCYYEEGELPFFGHSL